MAEPKSILGIDFTSAPSRRKSITCARASFDGVMLRLDELVHWHNFKEFEDALAAPGPWIAGMVFRLVSHGVLLRILVGRGTGQDM